MNTKYKWAIIIIVVFIVVGVYIASKNKSISQIPSSGNQLATVFQESTPTPTPTSTPLLQTEVVSNRLSPTPVSGETRGQIVCDFINPPAPNEHGSANIRSNWNNASVQICVSANGNAQTLVAKDSGVSGSRTDNINWISSNIQYIFTLYNNHPGDPTCSGSVLSSCKIGNQTSPTSIPQKR